MEPLVDVQGLRVVARGDDGRETVIVHDASFTVAPGEVVALIGESGSGKTTIALSLMGHAKPGCRITGGRIRVAGHDVDKLDRAALGRLRGRHVAYVAQSAAAAFNPAKPILSQVIEAARIHGVMTSADAEAKARALFRALALPDPDHVGERYPHQVSGGQLQRLLAAMALVIDPEVVIFDEPTTALDVTTQIEVLRAFKAVIKQRRMTALYVSHDLAVVAQVADRIVVLKDGVIREVGETAHILTAPQDDYTKSLIAAAEPVPRADQSAVSVGAVPLLSVSGLIAGYGGTGGDKLPLMPVLSDVSFTLPKGGALGIIGESGCGKSTLARVIAGLLPWARGTVALDGTALAPTIGERSKADLRRVQIVFQMADTALNPSVTVGRILARPIQFYFGLSGRAAQVRVHRLLDLVRLPQAVADRYPSELSGGQKQRVNLARALAAEPDLILCDEVTSALDTVVAAAVLDLLVDLRRDLGLSYMFISHDLATVRSICDDVMVLYAGHKVQIGLRSVLSAPPHHPYATLLMSSIPELRTGWLDSLDSSAAGVVPRPALADGCRFFPRCTLRVEGLCDHQAPPVWTAANGTAIACHQDEAALLGWSERAYQPA